MDFNAIEFTGSAANGQHEMSCEKSSFCLKR